MEIGKPIKRYTVVPLQEPVRAPEPAHKPVPERRERVPDKAPVREKEKEPA